MYYLIMMMDIIYNFGGYFNMYILGLRTENFNPQILYIGESMRKDSLCTFESSEKANIVRIIISFMNENYMKDISLDKISKTCILVLNIHIQIFKEETSNSPINYLIKIRLEKATLLLKKNKETSIKEISKLVGYQNAYYFSKLFKKYYDFSPI